MVVGWLASNRMFRFIFSAPRIMPPKTPNQSLQPAASMHAYEVRPCKDHRGVDLISDVLPFGRLWYDGPNAAENAIGYAMHYSRSHDAVIRVGVQKKQGRGF